MVEKWCKIPDEGGETEAILTDLSKAFDYIDRNLLKWLNVFGFEKQLIDLIYFYLTKLKQRAKVDFAVSAWEMLFSGVPKGFVLWPLLFNIFNIYMYIYIHTYIYAYILCIYILYIYIFFNLYIHTILLTCIYEIYKRHWFCFIVWLVFIGSKCHLSTGSKAPVCNFLILRFWMKKKLSCLEKFLQVDLISIFTWIHYHVLARVCNLWTKRNATFSCMLSSHFSYCPLV